jgi:hypothetical protein
MDTGTNYVVSEYRQDVLYNGRNAELEVLRGMVSGIRVFIIRDFSGKEVHNGECVDNWKDCFFENGYRDSEERLAA